MTKWAARGRAGDEHAVGFADEFDAIRQGGDDEPPRDEGDLVRLLERQALRGSVKATEILLKRLGEQARVAGRPGSVFAGAFDLEELDKRRSSP